MADPLVFVPGAMAQTGRVALVTGGDTGLGAAVVRGLAARGHAVAIHAHGSLASARDLAAELVAAGVPSLAVTADLRDEGPVRAMVHRVADHFGRIDALVACAAIAIGGDFAEVSADDLRTHFDVNCVGTFVVAQEAGMTMLRQPEGGCIVTVGAAAVGLPTVGGAASAPSHGALPALARSLAVEFAARHPRVRVNCVLPGGVAPSRDLDPQERAGRIARTLLKREGSPAHVAHAVLFLLENDFLPGVCLPVDGGQGLT